MFCPKCGAQNLDDAKFCRACGSDISLVPRALAGRLGDDDTDDADDAAEFDEAGRSRVERGTKKLVRGLCFLALFVASLFFARGVFFWMTFWFIFPAVSSISSGVGLLAQHAWRHSGNLPGGIKDTSRLGAGATTALPKFRLNEVAPADTAEIVAPPTSVTEGTTRHLDAVTRGDEGRSV